MTKVGGRPSYAKARSWYWPMLLALVLVAPFVPRTALAIEASREVVLAAELKGSDRGEKLLAKARTEGTLNLYAPWVRSR